MGSSWFGYGCELIEISWNSIRFRWMYPFRFYDVLKSLSIYLDKKEIKRYNVEVYKKISFYIKLVECQCPYALYRVSPL